MPETLRLHLAAVAGSAAGRVRVDARPSIVAVGSRAAEGPPSPFDANDVRTIRARRGELVVHAGAPWGGLYGVRSGSCKLVVATAGGDERIAGFRLAGELFGAEGLASGFHEASVHALEAVELWRLPSERMRALLSHNPAFVAWLTRALAREVAAGQRTMLLLGALTADQRVTSFLLDLAERYRHLGCSGSEFTICMTRAEIGRHLGLSTETVSRVLSRLRAKRWIAVSGRSVRLCDLPALANILALSR